MRTYTFALMGLLVSTCSHAQPHSAVPAHIRASSTLNRLVAGGKDLTSEFIHGIPLPPGKIAGDPYLTVAWQRGSILLYESEHLFEGIPVRFDVERNDLEVRTQSGVKVVEGERIKSFIWIDSITRHPTYFVNAKEYRTNNDQPLQGFLQVLSDGKMPAFVHTSVIIKKPDYNVQLDVGKRDGEILKKKVYYYLKDHQLLEIPGRKKQLLPVFGDHQAELESFMKLNALTLKDEIHLRAIFDKMNQLLAERK